jgi:Zn-dependent protease with chaperone function
MTERAELVCGAFLVVAAVAAATLCAAFAEIGMRGTTGIASVGVGLASACVLLALELPQLPPALVFIAAVAVATVVALGRGFWAVWCEQRLLRSLPTVALADSSYRRALALASPVAIHVLRSSRRRAFCAGILRPRVVVTTALLDSLDRDERHAVVAHELSHARSRGPLKLTLGHLAARAFFWAPVLRDLLDRYLLLGELAADRDAVAATSRSALAGALSQVLAAPRLAGSVGLADHAAARIDRLFDPGASLPPLLRPRRVALTAAVLAAVAVAVWSSPHLSGNESTQLHAMSVNLLAHHVLERLLGLTGTALAVAAAVAGTRRLAARLRHPARQAPSS